jgi:hypothetical protein
VNVSILFYDVHRSKYSGTYLLPFLGIWTCVVVSVAREHHVVIDKNMRRLADQKKKRPLSSIY